MCFVVFFWDKLKSFCPLEEALEEALLYHWAKWLTENPVETYTNASPQKLTSSLDMHTPTTEEITWPVLKANPFSS